MLVDIFVNVLALTTNRNQLEFSCLQRLSNKRLRKCDSPKKATLNHHSHALMTEYHYVGRRNTLIRKRPDLTTFIFQFFFFWEGRLKLYFCCRFHHSLHFQSIKLSTNKLLVHYWSTTGLGIITFFELLCFQRPCLLLSQGNKLQLKSCQRQTKACMCILHQKMLDTMKKSQFLCLSICGMLFPKTRLLDISFHQFTSYSVTSMRQAP